MSHYVDIQQLFNEVVAGQTKKLLLADQRDYEALRSSMLRKFRKYKEMLQDLGAPYAYEDKFLRCSFNKDEVSGTFSLADVSTRTNNRAKVYQVVDL